MDLCQEDMSRLTTAPASNTDANTNASDVAPAATTLLTSHKETHQLSSGDGDQRTTRKESDSADDTDDDSVDDNDDIRQQKKNDPLHADEKEPTTNLAHTDEDLNLPHLHMRHESAFAHVALAPPNAIFHLQDEYVSDKHEHKSNLVLGVAVNDDGSLVYFDTVRKVEQEILEATQDGKMSHGYPPIGGLPELSRGAARLILGDDHTFVREEKIQGIQVLSGTGALRIVGEFLNQYHRKDSDCRVYISNPTWANHKAIFTEAGFRDHIFEYRYYDHGTCGLDFDGMMEDLEQAREGDVVLLHACAHNPTGVDPTLAQWTAIAELCGRKNILPVFDCAYLGFASGDMDKDAEAMRHFANAGLEFFVCMSFSKNFGIYGQRCGSALFVSEDHSAVDNVISQLKRLSRPMWSVPPLHGGRIVTSILGNSEYRAHWKKEVRDLAERVRDIRTRLRLEIEEACEKLDLPELSWEHITAQRGMFSFTGLSRSQCEFLKKEHNIYMLPNGRINVCGVSSSKLQRIASAIADAVAKEHQDQ